MNNTTPESQVQKMLSIIYQIPMGLIETDLQGNVLQMNAKSVQLLMPLFFGKGLIGNNLHDLLRIILPDLLSLVKGYNNKSGNIIHQQRYAIQIPSSNSEAQFRHFLFTVNKLDDLTLIYIFDDITELYDREQLFNKIEQDKAIEQSKFEIASGVLHDIGNAVVGFGSYTSRIKRILEQNELATLEKLKGFVEKNLPALITALGDNKANAIVDLLSGVISSQHNCKTEAKQAVTDQMKIIAHVQEILSIQRQYVTGQSTERLPVNIRGLINDSVAMLFGTMEKKGISFHLNAPAVSPKIKGDRTQLMQVFLNLLKNSVDAFTAEHTEQKDIQVTVIQEETKITISIEDNGSGFDEATATRLFDRGYTTKAEGTGLGLDNCKKIVEAHNGEMIIASAGIGKGASSTVIFNL